MTYTDEIRRLLDEIDRQLDEGQDSQVFAEGFHALELPQLVADIADFLQPSLLPYEAAIYWHLFRHSIVQRGQPHLRVSVRGLTENTVTSSSGQGSALSYQSVQKALQGLETKGAIYKAGDTSREGTPYKVCLPEEIPLCREAKKRATPAPRETLDKERELDFYNVSENRLRVFDRDAYKCYKCGKQLTRFSATLDHIQPVSKGGDNSLDNLRTCCLHCNSQRGARPISDFLAGSS